MNKQEGIVVAIADEMMAKVKMSRHNDCESCGACPGNNAIILEVRNPIQAQPGQRVEVEVRSDDMLLAAFIVFLLPLAAAFAGTWGGQYLAERLGYDVLVMQVSGGGIAFLLAIAYIRYFDRAARSAARQPVITRVLS